MWGLAPSGLSQSTLGIKGVEAIGGDFNFIFRLEFGFDPYSLQFANSPGSSGTTGAYRSTSRPPTANARAGQFSITSAISASIRRLRRSDVFRNTSLMADGVGAFDPMQASYAFSPIGFSGAVAGGGDTENSRYSTSVKYRYRWRFPRRALVSRRLSVGQRLARRLGSRSRRRHPQSGQRGVVARRYRRLQQRRCEPQSFRRSHERRGFPIAPFLPQTYTATISDNTNVMALAKYTNGPLKLYAGYEWMQFAPPSDKQTSFTDIAGNFVCLGAPHST